MEKQLSIENQVNNDNTIDHNEEAGAVFTKCKWVADEIENDEKKTFFFFFILIKINCN